MTASLHLAPPDDSARIERAKSRMLFHDIQRRAACAEFTRLINARSPDRVARMEAERGLH